MGRIYAEDLCGGSMGRIYGQDLCGGSMRRIYAEDLCGGSMQRIYGEDLCGGSMVRIYVEDFFFFSFSFPQPPKFLQFLIFLVHRPFSNHVSYLLTSSSFCFNCIQCRHFLIFLQSKSFYFSRFLDNSSSYNYFEYHSFSFIFFTILKSYFLSFISSRA